MKFLAHISQAAFPSTSLPVTMRSDEHSDLSECAICLDTSDDGIKIMLSCGHLFCQSCLSQYVGRESREQRQTCCPLCKKALLNREVAACHEFLKIEAPELLAAIQGNSTSSSSSSRDEVVRGRPEDEACRACLEQFAHMEEMKRCPSCNALIEKNGGCDHMTCRCGHSFNWSEVPVLATSTSTPCNCVHAHPDFGVWGTTCPNSTMSAHAKLVARRAGLVAVAVPTAVGCTVLAGGLVLSAGLVYSAVATKRAVESTVGNVRSALQSPVTKAQREVDEAELKVQREEAKWFNWIVIAEAKASLEERQRLLQSLQADDAAGATGLFNWFSTA